MYETFSAGVANGKFVSGLYDNDVIVEEKYIDPFTGNPVCREFSTGIIPEEAVALMYHVQRVGATWYTDVWLGLWANIGFASTSWGFSPNAEYGQEIWARFGDTQNVIAPLNFGHKAVISSPGTAVVPWHDSVVSIDLKNRTETTADSPFHVMDLIGGDYTSIASCVKVADDCN